MESKRFCLLEKRVLFYFKCSDLVDSFKLRMVWLDWCSINVCVISYDLKKKKSFKILGICWDNFIVDFLFYFFFYWGVLEIVSSI